MPEKKKTGPKKFNSRGGSDDRKERGFRKVRKKICFFCVDKIDEIDFKNTEKLKKHISDKGKILPRRVSGNCAKHQRKVTEAIKIAREIALLPYTSD